MHDSYAEDKKDGFADVTVVTEKAVHETHLKAGDADVAATLVAGFSGELDPSEAKRILKKIDRNMMPMMMILYMIQFIDKTTLGNSVNLGLKVDNHLTADQYNNLGMIFYLAYLVFEWPQNLALQRFPAGKWMSANILCWSAFLMAHAACSSFAGLFICRLGLGICEGSITAGFLIVTTMFYTHAEASRRVGFWFLMNGTAQIFSGLLSFGILHSKASIAPWRIFMLVTGGLTFLVAVWYFLRFPDSPMNAKFLNHEEKVMAIERIRSNNSGIENKTFKKEQAIEALLDWKTWGFFLFAALDNVPNSLTNQNAIIIKSFGFTALQTTLLGCVNGVIEIITIYTGTLCIQKWPNSRAVIGAIYFIPNILGSALIIGLPFSNKTGMLISLYITGVGTTGFVLGLAWCTAVTSGHTKKTTTNALMLIGYCLGNLCAPQMWKAEYSPRNIVPWSIILACYTVCPILMLLIAHFLHKENKRRDALPESEMDSWIDEVQADGSVILKKIDLAFADMTDRKNLTFRYAL